MGEGERVGGSARQAEAAPAAAAARRLVARPGPERAVAARSAMPSAGAAEASPGAASETEAAASAVAPRAAAPSKAGATGSSESGAAGASDTEAAAALAFGAAVRELRQHAGLSLNQLARRAGVDPAYVHRIESRALDRPPLPRRAVVVAIAAALGLDHRQRDHLLTRAGYTPDALVELGGWDEALATVAELLADPRLSGPAKAEFREVLRILARRWSAADRATQPGEARTAELLE